MRDDDDLPVLSAVVRSGDADAIRSARLGSARAATRPARATDRSRLARADAFETGGVTRIDLGHGAIDIDANRDRAGARASRRLVDVRVALARELAVLGRVPTAADETDRLDDTLPLDEDASATALVRRHRDVAPAARPRRPGASVSAELIEDLVDEIVDRHVAALRRDVRDALERALDAVD